MGAVLEPWAASRLLRAPVRDLRDQHVSLVELWGGRAIAVQEALSLLEGEAALALVERMLVDQLVAAPHTGALQHALAMLEQGASVDATARALGRSPRTLNLWFDQGVGWSPAAWARLRRLQRALHLASTEPDAATVALRGGYADQSHLCRDMRDITGVTLTAWRDRGASGLNHIGIPASDSSKRTPHRHD